MNHIADSPLLVFAISFVTLCLAASAGFLLRKGQPKKDGDREDFAIVQGAALTLLGLLIGFTFSMAISRYDQRKVYEEAEANAIGTESVRAGLLPVADAAKTRDLLSNYLDQRVLFYTTRDGQPLRQIDAKTTELQTELWSVMQARAGSEPTQSRLSRWLA